MKRIVFALLAVMLLASGNALAGGIGDREKPAVDAAKTWLHQIDSGRYAESWQAASAVFRGAVTEQKWTETLAAVRKPLGDLQSRTETSAAFKTSLPGMPDGHYVVMTFGTTFANKAAAVETVTFQQESDGAWKAIGYFIK